MKKRIISFLLILCMTICLLPAGILSASASDTQTISGELWLGGTQIDVTKDADGSGPGGGSYSYKAQESTLTLTNYVAEGKNYHIFDGNQIFQTAAYLYTTLQVLKIQIVGNCRLGNEDLLEEYISDSKTLRTVGICSAARVNYTYILNGSDGKSGTLTVNSHIWPMVSGYTQINANSIFLNSAMQGSSISKLDLIGGNVTMASKLDGRYVYFAAEIDTDLYVGKNAKLTATSNGVAFTTSSGLTKYPDTLKVEKNLTVEGGILIAKSEGSNKGDGCQGRAISTGELSIQSGGRVEAYSSGYSTAKKAYDGREAVYIDKSLDVDTTSSLYAKTLNPNWDNDDPTLYNALRLNKNAKWNLENVDSNKKLVNNIATLTKPTTGFFDEEYGVVRSTVDTKPPKEIEITGLRKSVLTLGRMNGNNSWWYRSSSDNSMEPGGFGDSNFKLLDLNSEYKATFANIGSTDYYGFYGIDVQDGNHTVVLGDNPVSRDHTYITVRSGATLNLQLQNQHCLEYSGTSNVPIISVESGGTLNIVGISKGAALSLMGGSSLLAAKSGAVVSFRDCTVYTTNGTIGGAGAQVSLENCWVKADFAGNLSVKTCNVSGKHSDGNISIDRVSNVNLLSASGGLPTGVKDHDGKQVYRTVIKLEEVNSSANTNKKSVLYRTGVGDGNADLVIFPIITGVRLKIEGSPVITKNLTIFTGGSSSDEIYLWLPEGATVENIYGYDDGTATAVGYIYETKNEPIVTKAGSTSGGTMCLRNLLLGKGVFALKGTSQGDDTKLCADYQGNSSDNWIDYEPSKDIKLQSDTKVTGFGIRALENAQAEVKLNSLYLMGDNKRVEVDSGAALTLKLYDDNNMTASGEDAVLNLIGSLTIDGAEGSKKLTMDGKYAIAGSDTGELTITDSTVINECTDKTTPVKLRSLTVSNSMVTGLGIIDCDNIIIDGGNVDLDVTEGKVVKNSKGEILTKQTFIFDEKSNTKVDDLNITGLPDGSSFDGSNLSTDSNGKLSLWLPKGTTVTTVTIGDIVYYPRPDGSMTSGDKPAFTYPENDSSYVLGEDSSFSFSVSAMGTPAPQLQWQKSTDNGETWENIEGANGTEYNEYMTRELHNAKYRCVATNSFGNVNYQAESKVFTLYYHPRIWRSVPGGFPVKDGDDAELAVNTSDLDGLSGITAKYQWLVSTDSGKTWTKIDNAVDVSYKVYNVDMSYKLWRYRCDVTLTYPNRETYNDSVSQYFHILKAPVIGSQPQNQTVHIGETADFSIDISTDYYYYIHYQWQVSTDGINWSDIEGAKEKNYTTPTVTSDMNGWQYRCVVENEANNLSNFKASDSATLNVVYNVRFDSDGGTAIADKTDVKWTDKVLNGVSEPTKKGWRFDGWKCGDASVTADTTYGELAENADEEGITLTAQWHDTENPTGEITVDKNKWQKFISRITFGLFFKDTQKVTITASDNSGEDVAVEYLLSDNELTVDELNAAAFTQYTAAFNINPNNQYVIYAKLTDSSDNSCYINSDGMVLDNTAPAIYGVEDGKTYCEAQTVTVDEKYVDSVTVNGASVKLDNGQFSLSSANGKQTVVVTDMAGNITSVTVTVNSGHTYEWQSEDGKYWQKCRFCDHETDKRNFSEMIDGADKVCRTQDYILTFVPPEGSSFIGVKYEFGNLNVTPQNGEYKAKISASAYPADKSSFMITATAETEDGFVFKAEKSVEIQNAHSGGTATCVDKAKCEVCGESYGEIDPDNHSKLTYVPAKAATKDIEGNVEYWYCDGCGKYFADNAATKEITKNDTITPRLPSSDTSATAAENQSSSDTSAAAAENQSSSDTSATASENQSSSDTSAAENQSNDRNSPQTGNKNDFELWIILLFISGAATVGTSAMSKRKKREC